MPCHIEYFVWCFLEKQLLLRAENTAIITWTMLIGSRVNCSSGGWYSTKLITFEGFFWLITHMDLELRSFFSDSVTNLLIMSGGCQSAYQESLWCRMRAHTLILKTIGNYEYAVADRSPCLYIKMTLDQSDFLWQQINNNSRVDWCTFVGWVSHVEDDFTNTHMIHLFIQANRNVLFELNYAHEEVTFFVSNEFSAAKQLSALQT